MERLLRKKNCTFEVVSTPIEFGVVTSVSTHTLSFTLGVLMSVVVGVFARKILSKEG